VRKNVNVLLSVVLAFLLAGVSLAAKVDKEGKEWLGKHTDPAAINVNGFWYEAAWGTISLEQAQGSSAVKGSGDGWDITGVVSGKQVFLLFSHKGSIVYSATLTATSDTVLDGGYSRGLLREGESGKKTMHMIKK
jgi:hypothetical protein